MSPQLKASVFNTVFTDNLHYYLFNATSGALARSPKVSGNAIAAACAPGTVLTTDSLPAQLINVLIEHAFVVDANIDEYSHQHHQYQQAQQQPEFAIYCIAPTMRCNLKCSYCFQKGMNVAGAMSANVQAELVEHFTHSIANCAAVGVQWFGGEPLLNFDIIEKLTRQFTAICAHQQKQYFAEITTNGILLQKIGLERLAALSLSTLHLTLDGSVATYAKRKGLSYTQAAQWHQYLFTHLPELLELVQDSLVIRINADRHNFTEALELIDTIAQLSTDPKIKIRLGHLSSGAIETEPEISVQPHPACQLNQVHEKTGPAVAEQLSPPTGCHSSREEAIGHGVMFLRRVISQGFRAYGYPTSLTKACGASRYLSFVVDSEGFVGNCVPEIGTTKRNRLTTPIANLDLPYVKFDPFIHHSCQACSLLPACLGECPRNQLIVPNYACGFKKSIMKKIPLYFDVYATRAAAIAYNDPEQITILRPQ